MIMDSVSAFLMGIIGILIYIMIICMVILVIVEVIGLAIFIGWFTYQIVRDEREEKRKVVRHKAGLGV